MIKQTLLSAVGAVALAVTALNAVGKPYAPPSTAKP